MASLPSPASWRGSSEPSSSEPIETPTNSSSQHESSSQSFVLNEPQTSEAMDTPAVEEPEAQHATSLPEPQVTNSQPPAAQVETCWICRGDSTEDVPGAEWRRPCPCSLTAHEKCLLEWITTEEAPKAGEISKSINHKCPQCKAPIKIKQPMDLIVLAAGQIQTVAKMFVAPAAVSALFGCFYSGFIVYGVNTMEVVFGHEQAAEILRYNPGSRLVFRRGDGTLTRLGHFLRPALSGMDPFLPSLDALPNWKLFISLPLIAPTLVLLRTRVADKVFTILPITYFLFRPTTHLQVSEWPPSPALTMAVLPYIRGAYNDLYRRIFQDLEKKWDDAVRRKPREGETEEDVAAAARADDDFFDLEVELREEFIDEDGAVVAPDPEFPRRELQAPQPDVQEANAVNPDVRPQAEAIAQIDVELNPPAAPQQRPERRGWSTGSLITTSVGALMFPTISAVMGDILKHTLPVKWVGRGLEGKLAPRGLLHQKWGRTIVGGCLFVVLKDAVVLYCKWRKARDFGQKTVLDYVGKRNSDPKPVEVKAAEVTT